MPLTSSLSSFFAAAVLASLPLNDGRMLVLRAEQGKLRLTLDRRIVLHRSFDCTPRVQRMTASELSIVCVPEKASRAEVWKYFFDTQWKLQQSYVYESFDVSKVGSGYVASDGRRAFRIDGSRLRPAAVPPVQPQAARPNLPKLPQTTQREYGAAKPRTQRWNPKITFELREEIGPWQRAGRQIWFGKSFYDGEGHSGLGGFGYYDLDTRRYTLFSPREIHDWSATAILVEEDAVWLGLAHMGEWGPSPGGLLRWDRRKQEAVASDLPSLIGHIERKGEELFLANQHGLAVLSQGKIQQYFVDMDLRGRLIWSAE